MTVLERAARFPNIADRGAPLEARIAAASSRSPPS